MYVQLIDMSHRQPDGQNEWPVEGNLLHDTWVPLLSHILRLYPSHFLSLSFPLALHHPSLSHFLHSVVSLFLSIFPHIVMLSFVTSPQTATLFNKFQVLVIDVDSVHHA